MILDNEAPTFITDTILYSKQLLESLLFIMYTLFRRDLLKLYLFYFLIFNTLPIPSLTIPSANENYGMPKNNVKASVQAIMYLLLLKKDKHFYKCMSYENN